MQTKRKKTASLRDIAKTTGVSITTVSKVLNNAQGSAVSEEKTNLILKVAGELNYRPNRVARYFESGKTGQVAFVLPHEFFTNYSTRAGFPLIMEIYAGAVEYFAQHNYMTNLIFSPPENGQEFLRSTLIAQHSVDGAVLFAGEEELSMASEFEAVGIPVISFDWRSTKYDISHIEENPVNGVRQAVEYLKKIGHTSAACFYFYDEGLAKQAVTRSDVIVEQCEEIGIHVNQDYICTYTDETDAYIRTQELFSQDGEHPTVVFYPSDHIAMMGIRALQDLNVRVPEDVSVIGFDNATFNVNSAVPLASISVPRRTQGANGARLLLERIAKPEEKEVKTVSIHTEFINNTSVAPPADKTKIKGKAKNEF